MAKGDAVVDDPVHEAAGPGRFQDVLWRWLEAGIANDHGHTAGSHSTPATSNRPSTAAATTATRGSSPDDVACSHKRACTALLSEVIVHP